MSEPAAQVGGDVGGRSGSDGRVLAQQRRQIVSRSRGMSARNLCGLGASSWITCSISLTASPRNGFAGQQFEEDDPERVDVGPAVGPRLAAGCSGAM